MKKILDFLIIFLLAFLIISIFTNEEKKEITNWGVIIKTQSNSYSIPALVKLDITNLTGEEIKFNTCNDITLKSNWWNIDFGDKLTCEYISIKSWNTHTIDYSDSFYKLEVSGSYFFEANIWDKKPISTFELENRWTISKIFIAFIYQPIMNLMSYLIYSTNYSLGWWIVLITIIIRIILLWPQHKMMVSQKKLQAIQPKIKEIQNKNKGNQQQMWKDLMALYKKEKVNPMWSCGFLLMQMPILFVLYIIILEIRDPSNAYYFYSFLETFQIANISSNFYWVQLFKTGIELPIQWIILSLIVWVLQYYQIKLSLADKLKETTKGAIIEKKKGADSFSSMMPDPEMMNKFMLYGIPLMVTIFTFAFFAGLWLYWGITTIFMISQQLFVNKISKKK